MTTDLDALLEKRLADGEISTDDADTVRDFAAFLEDSSSRCLTCLTDDTDGADWRTHKKLGRVFLCASCKPPTGDPAPS